MGKILVCLSGGQDSTTVLYWAKKQYPADEIHAIAFDYGQRHAVELECAQKISVMADVASFEIITVGDILAGTSPLTNKKEEVETYKDAESLPGGLEKTFVPCRNMLFIVLALNRAYVMDAYAICLGVSQEDYGGYPDCREEFIHSMAAAGFTGLEKNISLVTPLIHLTKRETVELAMTLDGCMEALAHSHTCYKGEVPPCGECHSCLLREKGFNEAGVLDPLVERTKEAA